MSITYISNSRSEIFTLRRRILCALWIRGLLHIRVEGDGEGRNFHHLYQGPN
jgi:hypothetical protein